MSEHTPGPWKIDRLNWPMEMTGRFHRVLNHERFPTAFIPAWSEPDPGELDGSEEAQANARLIAAAPDLLNAVRFLLSNPDNRISAADVNAAEAVLAKVKA